MKKTIKVIIDANGNLEADFSGFRGNECESEEKRLREQLARYGIIVKNSKIIPKQILVGDIQKEVEYGTNKLVVK